MLPDAPETKAKLDQLFMYCVALSARRNAPFLEKMRRCILHEGRGSVYHRDDGIDIPSDIKEISVALSVSNEELRSLTLEGLVAKAFDMGREFAEKQTRMFFDTVSEACERDGTAFDAGGRVFEPSMILDMLEKMHIRFDDKGAPVLPSLVVSPSLFEHLRPKLEESSTNRELSQRHQKIMDSKRGEWLAEQARRRLVE